ncbi:hypothetical protein GCM10009097_20340 [Pigmentiphaga daeguensis]|uniref:Uncharacterized protein n=1 Tax=Pigmentiphaga daeguensis TaxID=414049 RepID=A0ABN1BR05_9BURK
MRAFFIQTATNVHPTQGTAAPGRPKAGPRPLGGLPRSGWGLTMLGRASARRGALYPSLAKAAFSVALGRMALLASSALGR